MKKPRIWNRFLFICTIMSPVSTMPAALEHPFLDDSLPIRWDSLSAEHIVPDMERALEEAEAKLEAIENQNLKMLSFESTVLALEEATEALGNAWGKVSHLENVNNTPEIREAYNAVLPKISAFFSGICLREKLWGVIKSYADTGEAAFLGGARARLLSETVKDFEESGAQLEPEQKERLKALDAELAAVTQKYGENVLDSTNAWELIVTDEARLAGLPENAKEAARHDALSKGHGSEESPAGRFTLHYPSFSPVLTYAEDESLRKEIWEAYITIGSKEPWNNTENILKILKLRQEKAALLGKANFADLILQRRMAKNGETAFHFITDLHNKVAKAFQEEVETMEAYRAEKTGELASPLEPWSRGYWAEKRRKELYDFDAEALRPYFPMDSVKRGMFELVNKLYGIQVIAHETSFEEAPVPGIVPTWNPEVTYYDVLDKDNTLLGSFYADWFPRETKRGGAWMVDLRTGERTKDRHEPHLGAIAGNLTRPVGNKPALLDHREVETIFHEFGHLLHHLLGNVEIKSLSGTKVAWDFVELPSQIMENWCWERESLDLFARHYETGEPIPEDLFEKMTATRNYLEGIATMRQLSFAKMDLDLHMHFDPNACEDLEADVQEFIKGYAPRSKPQAPSIVRSITHLFGSPVAYGAGYYSYKWAEALDADAFTRFKNEGLMSPEVGAEFREKILSKGNSQDPAKLFKDFMGREPDPEALLRRAGLL